MNIKSFAQILHRHRRTFNVPARTTASDGRVPRRFIRVGRFLPKRKIARILFFIFVGVNALAGAGDVAGKIDLR